ncbi:MAG: hypothetical protein ACREF4_08840, partial [Gammaproteobacteria bacterium]
PREIQLAQPNGSLGAFRLELTLPGAITESLPIGGNRIRLAVESERVYGAAMPQTREPFPRSHLRMQRRDGTADPRPASDFYLERTIPPALAAKLRHQRGFNKFISPWIVAIADPRASIGYVWASDANKPQEGCYSCDRPQHLQGKKESDGVYELYTTGRLLALRPDLVLSSTPYSYLGTERRLETRVSTVMADTVRPTAVLVAAQNPAIARGAIQDVIYLHSGEVEVDRVDLVPGGRAGWDVMFDRTYRSRSMGLTDLGQGWNSSMLRRVRVLPSGDVEYRDAAGEVWRYTLDTRMNEYTRPRGLFLNLTRTERGFRLVDQKARISDFDEHGRLVTEADEFADNPSVSSKGNIIRYLYGPDGRLRQIVDPLGRASLLDYDSDSGLLRQVRDWRGRIVNYDYDNEGRLIAVKLPDVENTNGTRPTIRYAYDTAGPAINDRFELGANLRNVTEPADSAPRVTYRYGSGNERDKVVRQEWTATGESATFSYPTPIHTDVEDALKQRREYTLSSGPLDYNGDRPHIHDMTETEVPVSGTEFGKLPADVAPGAANRIRTNRKFAFKYDDEGLLENRTLDGVERTTFTYFEVPAGRVLASTTTAPLLSAPGQTISRKIAYQPSSGAFVESIEVNGSVVKTPEPHRGNASKVESTNDEVTETSQYDEAGRLKRMKSEGGTDEGGKSDVSIEYTPDTGPDHSRGLPQSISRPVEGLAPVRIERPNGQRTIQTDERNVRTDSQLDTWLRPKKINTSGPDLVLDEEYQYDAGGRMRVQERQQDQIRV